jgi:hypothetical protein
VPKTPGNILKISRRKILWPNSHVEHRRFLVSRKHIQSLSPRWNEYVKRNTHRHPVPLRLPQIVFQNEDPHALSLILYIAHHLTRCLPQSLTLDEIVNLAKISQRYDLNHILVGYLDQWLTPHRADILLPGYEKWLYVAWQFGIEADYVELANHLSKHCAVNARGRLLLPTTNEPIEDDGVFPPNALCKSLFSLSYLYPTILTRPPFSLALVHQARAKAFRELLTATQTFIREILLKPSCKLYEAPIAEQNACTARSSHGLQRYLAEHGILANAPGSKYLYSVWHLGRILTSHDVIEYMRQGGDEVTKHDDVCRVDSDLHDRVVKVVKGWSWAVNKEMITQLRTNAGEFKLFSCMVFLWLTVS